MSDQIQMVSLLSIATMDSPLKLFQVVKTILRIIGIYSSEPNPKQCSVNARNTIFLICNAQITFTTFAFLLFEADSLFDYGFGFFASISLINCTVIYLLFMGRYENTMNFIETCEKFVEKSK